MSVTPHSVYTVIGVDASQAQIPPEQVPPHSLMFQLKKHRVGVGVGVLVVVGVGVGVGVIPQGPSDKISTSGSEIGEIHEHTA